jgi:hypothetical protein
MIFWERKGKCINPKKEKTPVIFRGSVENWVSRLKTKAENILKPCVSAL